MKKLVSLILISMMVFPSLALAAKERKECVECSLKANAAQEEKIVRTCNDVSDIICKDVKAEDRRGCSESDGYIFSKNTSKMDVFNFAKGCFKSSVTSFTQFFTDFIPELLKGIWDATKSVASLAAKSVSGDEPGLWSKLKGMYESTSSVASDIYEAVQENPGAYFDKIWSKIVDVVGPMVANYDCLKPQKKVENICGFVAEWLVPPAVLAKVLVRGIKEVKFLQKAGVFSMTSSGKLAKALEFAEKRSVLTLKQLQEMEKNFASLGYTRDEFALIYKSGGLEKVKLADLKPLTTAEGRAQKLELLGEPKVVKATAATTTATAAQAAPKKPAAPVAPKHVDLNLTSDFITIPGKGSHGPTSGQIVGRIVEDGKEVAYRLRMVDETGKVTEVTLTNAQLARVHPTNATAAVAEKVADAVKKDGKYSPEDEFRALQKEHDAAIEKANRPDDIKDSILVEETGMAEFEKVQAEVAKKEATAKAAREAGAGPSTVDGMDVHDSDFGAYEKAIADNKSVTAKASKDAEAKAHADFLAEQKRIKDQGIVHHDGVAVEELPHDDPRYHEVSGEKKPDKTEYIGGIDYVPTPVPGKIVRNTDRLVPVVKPLKAATDAEKAIGPFNTNYIQVMMKNSMGMTAFMPAQIVRKVVEGTQVKYVIRMLDKASNTYKEKTVTAAELKLQMKAKEAKGVEKEIQDFNRQTGFHEDLDH